jgi:hypothetical protein
VSTDSVGGYHSTASHGQELINILSSWLHDTASPRHYIFRVKMRSFSNSSSAKADNLGLKLNQLRCIDVCSRNS